MPNGPISRGTLETIDIVAPAGVAVSAFQVDNQLGAADMVLPTVDSDGSPLTGLSRLTLVTSPLELPLTHDEILAAPGANVQTVAITPADAGSNRSLQFPLYGIGAPVFYACWASDD